MTATPQRIAELRAIIRRGRPAPGQRAQGGATTGPANVRRHVDMYGQHGWLYEADGRTILEHCTAGRWHGCLLGVQTEAYPREVDQAALTHLRRKPHHGPLAPVLMGPDLYHAGGGVQHPGPTAPSG